MLRTQKPCWVANGRYGPGLKARCARSVLFLVFLNAHIWGTFTPTVGALHGGHDLDNFSGTTPQHHKLCRANFSAMLASWTDEKIAHAGKVTEDG